MSDQRIVYARHRKHVANGVSPARDCHYCDIELERLEKEKQFDRPYNETSDSRQRRAN